jgi:hypothetical protein
MNLAKLLVLIAKEKKLMYRVCCQKVSVSEFWER